MVAQDTKAERIFVPYPQLRDCGIFYCRVHLNRMIAVGTFPAPVRLSANRVAWRLADIEEWSATRPVARTRPLAGDSLSDEQRADRYAMHKERLTPVKSSPTS